MDTPETTPETTPKRVVSDQSVCRPTKKKASHKPGENVHCCKQRRAADDARHKHKRHVEIDTPVSQPTRNIVGWMIKHNWREDHCDANSQWTGTVLDQCPVNPSLFLIKYHGFDCVYGLEILRDQRVSDLEILPAKIPRYKISDARVAERILGRTVEHQFETENGVKDGWRGLVLAQSPVMPSWFYITYEKDPVLYMYQLLEDYKEGDLQILQDDHGVAKEPGEVTESLVGKQVEYVNQEGALRKGTVIQQVEAKPTVYFIKFDDDDHIYVYDMV